MHTKIEKTRQKIDLVKILKRNNIDDSGLLFKLIDGDWIYQLIYSTLDNQFYVIVYRSLLTNDKPYITGRLESFVGGELEATNKKTFYVDLLKTDHIESIAESK